MHIGMNVSVRSNFSTDSRDAGSRTHSPRAPMLKGTALFSLVLACIVLPACNTTKGVGEDVEAAGEGIQNAADGAKDGLKN